MDVSNFESNALIERVGRAGRKEGRCAYTWTFFNDTAADVSAVGKRSVDSAASPATTRATVVKKPKTACTRLRLECMVDGCARGERHGDKREMLLLID